MFLVSQMVSVAHFLLRRLTTEASRGPKGDLKEVEVCHHWNHGQCNKIIQLIQAEAVKDVEGR